MAKRKPTGKLPDDPAEREQLAARLRFRLKLMEALIEGVKSGAPRLAGTVRAGGVAVRAAFGPASDPDDDPESLCGAFFSPVEAAVWLALVNGPLKGRRLAARTHQRYDDKFRTILANMRQRGAHALSKEAGYARANANKERTDAGQDDA